MSWNTSFPQFAAQTGTQAIDVTQLPLQYSREAGDQIAPLPEEGVLRISGPDAAKLLQGQLTIDVEKLSDTRAGLAALCNPQGRVIGLFFCLRPDPETYYLILPADNIAAVQAVLRKYAVFFKCEIENLSDHWLCMGKINGHSPDDSPSDWSVFCKKDILEIAITSSLRLAVARTDSLAAVVSQNDDATPLHAVHPQVWYWHLFKTGVPRITATTSESFLPHSLNLPHLQGVDFDKGCYTGQEVVARMHYRGKLKNHLQLLEVECEGVPREGAELEEEGATVGQTVCLTSGPQQRLVMLAVLKDSSESRQLTSSDLKLSILSRKLLHDTTSDA